LLSYKTLQDPEARKTLVADLHKLKTDLFMRLVETGAMPLRPGVQRLVQEAVAAGETKACAFFLVVLGCTVGILRGQLVAAGAAMLWPRVKRLVEEAVAAGGFASRVVLGAPIAFSRVQLVETGAMPLRPEVKRLVQEAVAAGGSCASFFVFSLHTWVSRGAAGSRSSW
jgi:hypothetical protein